MASDLAALQDKVETMCQDLRKVWTVLNSLDTKLLSQREHSCRSNSAEDDPESTDLHNDRSDDNIGSNPVPSAPPQDISAMSYEFEDIANLNFNQTTQL